MVMLSWRSCCRRVLAAVVPHPKERSSRWLSTSFPLDAEDAAAKTCGPDYHVRTPLNSTAGFGEHLHTHKPPAH